jgi:hypothetical protein
MVTKPSNAAHGDATGEMSAKQFFVRSWSASFLSSVFTSLQRLARP